MLDSISSDQKKLSDAQAELASGRHFDVGLTLGNEVGRNLNWRIEIDRMQQTKVSNQSLMAKADASQASLDALKKTATDFMNILVSARNAPNGAKLVQQAATLAMGSLQDEVNVNYNGMYLMAGQNTAVPPLSAYKGGAAETAVNAAFQSTFGFSQTDPAAATITPAAMKQFLDGTFNQLFQSPSWNNSFSTATDINGTELIDKTQSVGIDANANEQPVRDLMRAITAALGTGPTQLNQSSFQTVIDNAVTAAGDAISGIGDIQSRIGLGQSQITSTNTKFDVNLSILDSEVTRTEGVDNAEVSSRINNLMMQLQASYTVTGRIAKLSLMNFM